MVGFGLGMLRWQAGTATCRPPAFPGKFHRGERLTGRDHPVARCAAIRGRDRLRIPAGSVWVLLGCWGIPARRPLL